MHDPEMSKVEHSYFNDAVIAEENEGTYADRDADIKQSEYGLEPSEFGGVKCFNKRRI